MTKDPPKPRDSQPSERQELSDQDLREQAEQQLTQKDAPILEQRPRELLHELEVHRIELEMQNESLRQAQETIVASQQRYADLYDSAPVGYFTLDAEELITDLNLTGASLLSSDRSFVKDKPFSFFVSVESRDAFHEHHRRVIATGQAEACELRLIKKNTSRLWVLLQSVPVWDAHKKVIAVRSVISDITDRKRAERRVQREMAFKDFLLLLHQKAPQLSDKDLYDYFLEQMVQLTESTVGFFHRVSDDQKSVILTTWNREALKSCTASYETHYLLEQAGNWADCVRLKRPVVYNDFLNSPNQRGLPDGHAPVRRFMSIPVLEEDKVTAIFGVGNKVAEYDDTDAVQVQLVANALHAIMQTRDAERALRTAHHELEQRVKERTADVEKERRRLFDVLETLPAMICLLTPDYHVAFANRSFREKFGESRDRYCYEFCFGKTKPCEFCESYEVLKTGKPHHWEVTTPDGSAVIDAWDFPFTDVDGSPLILEMDIDITDRKRTEAELKSVNAELRQTYEKLKAETQEREQAEAQLRQAQKMEALGTLSGGIAHDFNNLLAAIIGFTELVAEHAPAGSRDEHHLHRVMEASLRGRELVKQMLTFSRSTAGEKKPLLLSSIVKETVRLLRATTPTTISIKVTILSESGLILGDPTQIQQILMNLCTNATYAMREKGGILDIELGDFSVARSNGNNHDMEPGLYMKLVIRDTGAGIPPDITDKIFDPFFTTKKLGEGTGLGLSVVHGIVKRSGGYITVESPPGKGSTFTVYFPKVAGEEKAVAPAVDIIPTGSERVLFVDDEEAIVEMSEDVLAELGYEVTSRTSSKEALALLKENPSRFDLVITDQTMPEMTGVELAKEILTVRPDIPVILCTGFSHLVDAEGAAAAGIRAFAMKPLTKREIARTMRKVLDKPST